MVIWNFGGVVQTCGRGIEVWSELWECAAGVETWVCRGMEIGSLGGMLRARGCGGVELWRSGDLEACCRSSGKL